MHPKLNTTIRLFFKILDYEISLQDFKIFICFYSIKLAIQLSICNFIIYFEMLILCSSETCVFVLIRFSNGRLVSYVFVLLIFINNVGICIIL